MPKSTATEQRKPYLAPDAPTYVVFVDGLVSRPNDLQKFADAMARFKAEVDDMLKPSRGMVTLLNQRAGKRLRRFDADSAKTRKVVGAQA